ncbi:MAG: hypothetical protein ABI778_03860, partial [Ignavibacteriota bacterium]
RAVLLQSEQDHHLYDSKSGAYFTSRESAELIIRTKNDYDGAEPSGNSITVLNLLKLHALTDVAEYRGKAERTLLYFAGKLAKYPYTMPEMLVGMDWLHYAPTKIVFVGDSNCELYRTMRDELSKFYLPRALMISSKSESLGEFTKNLTSKDGEFTLYFCTNQSCELPVTDIVGLKALLEKTRWKSE